MPILLSIASLHPVDLAVLVVYIVAMPAFGLYYQRRNKTADDYFVGGRNMGATHVGLSVVATDVGGGFSIGLGGLGFTMGLSGSWMLFTGLIGAWLAAVFLIPRVRALTDHAPLLTLPEFFGRLFNRRVATAAAVVSFVGYLGFTSSQILAGAKLAASAFPGVSIPAALWAMGALIVVYTARGGLKAVIY